MGVAAKAADQRVILQLLVKAAAQAEHGAVDPVSYTHLDVYKRQMRDCARFYRGKP